MVALTAAIKPAARTTKATAALNVSSASSRKEGGGDQVGVIFDVSLHVSACAAFFARWNRRVQSAASRTNRVSRLQRHATKLVVDDALETLGEGTKKKLFTYRRADAPCSSLTSVGAFIASKAPSFR